MFLYKTTVGQHDGTKVARGMGADHRAPESLFVKIGDHAGMVDVGMGEDDVVHRGRIDTGFTVFFVRSKPFSLKAAAIKQEFFAGWGCQEVFASRYFLCCTQKSDFHMNLCFLSTVKVRLICF